MEDRLNDAWLQFAKEESDGTSAQPADAVMGAATADGGSQLASVSSKESDGEMKIKKPIKIAMEALIRGFEKYIEEEDDDKEEVSSTGDHKVSAWHNVPYP